MPALCLANCITDECSHILSVCQKNMDKMADAAATAGAFEAFILESINAAYFVLT